MNNKKSLSNNVNTLLPQLYRVVIYEADSKTNTIHV